MVSMSEPLRSVLVVGAETPAMHQLVPLLQRTRFDVATAATAGDAAALAASRTFNVIVIAYPLAGLELPEFIPALRHRSSPSRTAGLLLLSHPNAVPEAETFVGHGVNRVVDEESGVDRLLFALADLIGEAPRIALRAVVQLDVRVGNDRDLALFETVNLSVAGMLVRAPVAYPVGTPFRFELDLPGLIEPLRGKAEVVRHTDPQREPVKGFAARFISFAEGGKERLEAFIAASRR